MYKNNSEAAYCKERIQRSKALAKASGESCARLSHEAMAVLYERRLSDLTQNEPHFAADPVDRRMTAPPGKLS